MIVQPKRFKISGSGRIALLFRKCMIIREISLMKPLHALSERTPSLSNKADDAIIFLINNAASE
jgi:hypothetical protein